jgi:hypothetical protein
MMNHISDSNELMADINEIVSSSPMIAEIKVVLSFFSIHHQKISKTKFFFRLIQMI